MSAVSALVRTDMFGSANCEYLEYWSCYYTLILASADELLRGGDWQPNMALSREFLAQIPCLMICYANVASKMMIDGFDLASNSGSGETGQARDSAVEVGSRCCSISPSPPEAPSAGAYVPTVHHL